MCGLPILRPFALAFAIPERTRSRIIRSSSSANTPLICLSDVTRPVKKELPQYLHAEEKLQNAIWQHFIGRKMTGDELKQIFEIDDIMLSAEFHQLMPEELNDDYRRLQSEFTCEYQAPSDVREQFMTAARKRKSRQASKPYQRVGSVLFMR